MGSPPRPSSTSRSAASASTTSSARTASTCSSSATSSSAARRSTPSSSRRQSCKPVCTRAAARAVYLPFNVIPHIDKFLDDKYTKEERKVTWETRKIMDLPDLPVSCTCVRIPTLRAHGESITIETEKPINMERAYAVLNEASGVVVVDDTSKNLYPMPI